MLTLTVLLVLFHSSYASQPNSPDEDPGVRAARDSIRADPHRPDLWLSLAHVCWELGTIEGRREADEVFEDALRKWPKNSRILLDWAELNMERRFYSRAKGLYRRALKLVPDSEPAQLGLVHLALYDYRRRLSVKSLNEANFRLDQLLKSHPGNADGLASSAFTRMMRADTTGAVDRADELVRRHPDDPRGHFFKLYFGIDRGLWDEASDEAGRALRCLKNPKEIEAYRSLERIHWGWEDRREALSDSARVVLEVDFWKRRDPTPATMRNERHLEHLRRVFLADLLYGLPEHELRGWDTEPGEAVIRFGMPMLRSISTGSQISYSFRAERLTHVQLVNGNVYEVIFEDQFLSGNWFEPFDWGRVSLLDKLASLLEGTMTDPVGGPPIEIKIDAVQFMGAAGKTRLELIVSVPMAPDSATAWKRPLALYDGQWQLLAQRGGTFAEAGRVRDREHPGSEWLVDVIPISVDPSLDSLFIGSEVDAGRWSGHGGSMDRLMLRTFHEDSLEISDVMLLDRIDPDMTSGPFARKDGGTIPSPDATYQPGESIPIYFEAYGLSPAPDGRYLYTLEVEINDLKTFGEWASRRRSSLTENRRPRRARSISRFEEWSPTPSVERMLDLSVGRLPKGDYWVRVVIEDLTGGRKNYGEGAFRIVSPKPEKERGTR